MRRQEEEEQWKRAEQAFRKRRHKAKLVMDNGRYTAIDWQREDGSGEYYVNYIVDKERGSLIISGDLGNCIATWYNPVTVSDLARYVGSIQYFIGKFQAASDDYEFDEDDAAEEILDDIKRYYDGEDLPEEFEEEWQDFVYGIPDNTCDGHFRPDREQRDFLEKYFGPDWWEGFHCYGRSISFRVFLWAEGFRMAVAQLKGYGILKEGE